MPFQLRSVGCANGCERVPLGVGEREQARDQRRRDRLRRPPGAVIAFDGDAQAVLGNAPQCDPFGAGLDEDALAEKPHDLGSEAPGAGHVPGLVRAGRPQPRGGACPVG